MLPIHKRHHICLIYFTKRLSKIERERERDREIAGERKRERDRKREGESAGERKRERERKRRAGMVKRLKKTVKEKG